MTGPPLPGGPEPMSAEPIADPGAVVLEWAEVRSTLSEAHSYWLATVHPSGHSHVRPVLGVWADGAWHTTSSPEADKARNLALDPRCTVSVGVTGIDVVLEGTATPVTDRLRLERIQEAYATKYGWPVTIEGGAFTAPYGAPTAGPPPYQPYAVTPDVVFAFGTDEGHAPRSTRWRF